MQWVHQFVYTIDIVLRIWCIEDEIMRKTLELGGVREHFNTTFSFTVEIHYIEKGSLVNQGLHIPFSTKSCHAQGWLCI